MKYGRVLGVDDGYFERGTDSRAPLVGVVMKKCTLEEVHISFIEVDGNDATEKIMELIQLTKPSVTFLYGTVFGGTNVVDLYKIPVPVISVLERKPTERFYRTVGKYYPVIPLYTRRGKLHTVLHGIDEGTAVKVIETYQCSSKFPEPIRIADIIGREVGRKC